MNGKCYNPCWLIHTVKQLLTEKYVKILISEVINAYIKKFRQCIKYEKKKNTLTIYIFMRNLINRNS